MKSLLSRCIPTKTSSRYIATQHAALLIFQGMVPEAEAEQVLFKEAWRTRRRSHDAQQFRTLLKGHRFERERSDLAEIVSTPCRPTGATTSRQP